MENLKAIILAAGEGTRMHSKKPKVLHEILGRTMIDYVINATRDCNINEVCIVVGHQSEQVRKSVGNKEGISFAKQEVQLGTGHAVMQAIDFIENDRDILVLYGDTPLITADTLESFIKFHREEKNDVSIISAIVSNPQGYGHIVRDEFGKFVKNIEHKDANEKEKITPEINTGIYCFKGKKLKEALSKITNNNVQNEYYLPDTLEILLNQGGLVNAMISEDMTEFFGVNSMNQLAVATDLMKMKINITHMQNGVTLTDQRNTYISPDVKIGQDTIILPGCVIEGNTEIGDDCIVGPNSRMTNMILRNNVKFQSSTGMNSCVGSNTTVGPYAYIRPNCNIGENVKIGDFVEVKNSNIGNNTKISHLTYIGDTDAGMGINFGCGTVTVNYDGKKKFRTVIEDDVFVGCNANLVAPVTLKKGCYVAAGSTVTKNVCEKDLAVARAKQINIKNWVQKREEK